MIFQVSWWEEWIQEAVLPFQLVSTLAQLLWGGRLREYEGFKRYSFPWFLMMHDDIYLVKRYVARCFITWLYTTYGITYGKYFLELNYTRFHFVSPDTRHIREKKNFYGDSIFFSWSRVSRIAVYYD